MTIHTHQMRMKRMKADPGRTKRKGERGRRRKRAQREVIPENAGRSALPLRLRLHPVHQVHGDDDSNDSSSESSRLARIIRKELKKQQKKSKDRDRENKAKEADKVLIPKFPTPEKYRDWKIKVRDNIAAASAKPDDARSWVGKVYKESQTIEGLDDSEGFATLDAKLLASLTNCAEGDLGRQIATFKELRAREEKPVKGRHLLLRFHEYFATSIRHGAIYGLEDLMSVKMVNDDLKGFINKWDSVLAGMKKEPENNVLEAYFHLAVKRFKPLEHDLALYDRAAEGSKERSYDFLITAARAYLERKRLEKMRDATKRSLGAKDVVVPAPEDRKGVCFDYQKTGKCKRGSSCPYKHEKGRDKSKGKGKDRSQSRSRSLTPGSRKETCKFWKAGSWVGKVYKESQTIEGLDDSEGFATLDAKLLASLTNCAEGDLGRQIATFKELRAREEKPVKGRHLLLRFHEYFATSIRHGAIYGLEDLMSVKMVNDDLKGFINKWDSVLAGMKKEPENNVLEAYFHLAVKRFKPLEHDLALYDRAAEGSKERSYDFLITAARAYLERKRLEKMRDATKRSLGAKDVVVPAPEDKKGVCFDYQKTGKCKRGSSCPYKHEKGRDKSKGKGKDRSQSRSRSLTPGSQKETCKFWKAGHCHRGKDCAFQRPEKTVPAKKEDRKKKKKEKKPHKRSSSRGSSGSDNSTG